MTANRLTLVCIVLAATGCAHATTGPAPAEPTPDTATYLTDLGHVDGINDRTLITIGRQLCTHDYLADFDEGAFFDQAGVLNPDRDRVTTAAHTHLC